MSEFQKLLSLYGEDHQNRINKLLHIPCVPLIYVTAIGLLWAIKLGDYSFGGFQLNAAIVIAPIIMAIYFRMSATIAVGMLGITALSFWFSHAMETALGAGFWQWMLGINLVSWIIQFIGHAIEGKKPSSAKGLKFLLVGPAWVVSEIYNLAGIKY